MTGARLRRPVRLAVTLATLAAAGGGFVGCGQKGPLYLPGESPQQVEPGIPTGGAGPGATEEEPEEDAAAER
ncbi:LPS translocon maturation chaperone LptM [Lentisalinibacter orientalis]|uniref:LPS translocon maturation chaperone LptM n=1 Tax=Lentisalinibacter orientalis TaxID=2992241 RepID=UPI00386B7826